MMTNSQLRIVEPQIPDMMTNSEIKIAKPRKPEIKKNNTKLKFATVHKPKRKNIPELRTPDDEDNLVMTQSLMGGKSGKIFLTTLIFHHFSIFVVLDADSQKRLEQAIHS